MHFILCVTYSKTVNNHVEQFVSSSGKVRLIKWSHGVNQTPFLWEREACRSVLIIYTKIELYVYTASIDRVYNWIRQVWPSQRDDSSALKQNNTAKESGEMRSDFLARGRWNGVITLVKEFYHNPQISVVFPYSFQTVRLLVGDIIRAEGMRVGRGNNVMTLGILLEYFLL